MAAGSWWGITPRESIESACRARGATSVIDGCLTLLSGGDADAGLVRALGGPDAARFLDAPPGQRYWLRVWGARGLLWALPADAPGDRPEVVVALVSALEDEHWRVREMAAKVVARNRTDEALTAITALADDPVPRVRVAAARALRVLTSS